MVEKYSSLRQLIWSIYVPGFLFHLCNALIVSALPLYVLRDMNEDAATVGMLVSSVGMGKVSFYTFCKLYFLKSPLPMLQMIGNIPSGAVTTAVGVKQALVISGGMVLLASLLASSVTFKVFPFELVGLLLANAIFGMAMALNILSRQTMLASHVLAEIRGSAASFLGGVARLAYFVGPFLGGYVQENAGKIPVIFKCIACVLSDKLRDTCQSY